MSSFKILLSCHCKEYFDGNIGDLLDFEVPHDIAQDMIKEMSSEEIRNTLFGMDNNKALRPNGFGAYLGGG